MYIVAFFIISRNEDIINMFRFKNSKTIEEIKVMVLEQINVFGDIYGLPSKSSMEV